MVKYATRTSGLSGVLFALQLCLAPPFSIPFGLLTGIVVDRLLGLTHSNLVNYGSFGLVGFCLGYAVQTGLPRAYISGGRWVWVWPMCLLALSVVDELKESHNVFEIFADRPGNPGGAMVQAFLTLPAVASCLYSLGIIVANRRSGGKSATDGRTPARKSGQGPLPPGRTR